MIRRMDSIADPDTLVGRWVLQAGPFHRSVAGRPMRVVRRSKSRLHVTERPEDAEDRAIPLRSVVFVCDTLEDCEALGALNDEAFRVWEDFEARRKEALKAIRAKALALCAAPGPGTPAPDA